MSNALGKPAARGGRPALHRARRHRKRRAFTDTEQNTHKEKAGHSASEPGQNRRAGPDQTAGEQRPARSESIAYPSPEHLKREIGVSEDGEDQAILSGRQGQLAPDVAGRGRDVHAIDVRDQVHQTQEEQDETRRSRSQESLPPLHTCLRKSKGPSSSPSGISPGTDRSAGSWPTTADSGSPWSGLCP